MSYGKKKVALAEKFFKDNQKDGNLTIIVEATRDVICCLDDSGMIFYNVDLIAGEKDKRITLKELDFSSVVKILALNEGSVAIADPESRKFL